MPHFETIIFYFLIFQVPQSVNHFLVLRYKNTSAQCTLLLSQILFIPFILWLDNYLSEHGGPLILLAAPHYVAFCILVFGVFWLMAFIFDKKIKETH